MNKSARNKIAIALAILILLFSMLSFFKIDVVTPGRGVVSGASNKIDIVSPSSGLIKDFNIKTGQEVFPGEVLFSYTNLDAFYKEKSLRSLLEFSNEKIKSLKQDKKILTLLLKGDINTVKKIFNSERVEINNGELISYKFFKEYEALEFEKELYEKKKSNYLKEQIVLSSQKNILDEKSKLLMVSKAPAIEKLNNQLEISRLSSQMNSGEMSFLSYQSDINNRNNTYTTQLIETLDKINNQLYEFSKTKLEKDGEIELLKNKLNANNVESPVHGVILNIEKNLTNNSYIETNQTVLTIKKEQGLRIIEAKFDAKYRPFLYIDGKARLVIDSPGFKKFLTGRISKISPDSFSDENKNDNYRYYKVDIIPEGQNDITSEYEGVQVNVFAISKKISIMSYLTALIGDNLTFNVW
nr:HlyD family efflux transporter periplasmic adaptor subunit [Vibrio parahaemolyticus]